MQFFFGSSGLLDFRRAFGRQGGPRLKKLATPAGRLPRFEFLEDRRLLSIGVNTLWLADLTLDEQFNFYSGNTVFEWSNSTDQGVDGRLVLPGVLLDAVSTEGLDFTRLQMPGWGTTNDAGIAELPVFRTWLTVPSGVDVIGSCRAEMMTSLGKGFLVYPAQEAVSDSIDEPEIPFSFDTDYYRGEAVRPTNLLGVSEPMIARGTSMVLVEIAPFCYEPVSGEIIVATDVTLSFEFRRQEEDAAASDLGSESEGATTRAADADYLIIVADQFVNEIQPLAAWKHIKGYRTYVAPMSEVGTTHHDVLAYISNAYHTGTRTSYVLIVGDHENVPSYPLIDGTDVWHSDYPYACVDGTDLLADLAIGRFSGDTKAQITTMVNKQLAYERTPDMGDWYDDMLVAAWFQDTEGPPEVPDGIGTRWFMETGHRVADFVGGDYDFWSNPDPHDMGYTVHTALAAEDLSFSTYYYRPWGYTGRITPPSPVPSVWTSLWTAAGSQTGVNITNAVNNGVGFLMNRSHGGISGWGSLGFSTTSVNALTNGNRLPVVFSIGCSTGHFDTADCFAEAWLRKSGGGAIGVAAAARGSLSGYNDLLAIGIMDTFWEHFDTWTSSVYPTSWRPAEALNRAKQRVFQGYSNNLASQNTARLFNWFGDPEMMLRTQTPSILTVDHPTYAFQGTNTDFTVAVTSEGAPVAGALVCISHASADDYWVGATNASGEVTFLDVSLSSMGDYSIVVTEQNAVPYQGSFTVQPVFVVNSLADVVAVDGALTLREAIEAAGTNTAVGDAPAGSAHVPDLIVFDPSLFGGTIFLSGSELEILDKVKIEGPGVELLTIDAGGLSRVFSIGSDGEADIAGLTIRGGSAQDIAPTDPNDDDGGGFFNNGVLNLTDVVVRDNSAQGEGGGVYNKGAVTVVNATFVDNTAVIHGGALHNEPTGATNVNGSTFSDNTVFNRGGAIYNLGSLSIDGSTFTGNAATTSGSFGGAVGTYNGATAQISGSTFHGNTAEYGGGVFGWQNTVLTVVNSAFSGNSAGSWGGGLFSYGNAALTVVNTTVAGNAAGTSGGGIYNLSNCQLTLQNSIVALNTAPSAADISGLLEPASGHNLVGIDPVFVRNPSDGGDGWGDNPATPDIDESANDDYGDLRLRLDSPAINAGSNTLAVGPDGTPLTVDVVGQPRVVYGTVDLGSHEFQVVRIPGDVNLDNVVNGLDAAIVAQYWGQSGMTWAEGDFDGDGVVGPRDSAILAAHFGMAFTLPAGEVSVSASIEADASTREPFIGPLPDLDLLASRRLIEPSVRVASRPRPLREAVTLLAPGETGRDTNRSAPPAEAVDAVLCDEYDGASQTIAMFGRRAAWTSLVARRTGQSRADVDDAETALAVAMLLAQEPCCIST